MFTTDDHQVPADMDCEASTPVADIDQATDTTGLMQVAEQSTQNEGCQLQDQATETDPELTSIASGITESYKTCDGSLSIPNSHPGLESTLIGPSSPPIWIHHATQTEWEGRDLFHKSTQFPEILYTVEDAKRAPPPTPSSTPPATSTTTGPTLQSSQIPARPAADHRAANSAYTAPVSQRNMFLPQPVALTPDPLSSYQPCMYYYPQQAIPQVMYLPQTQLQTQLNPHIARSQHN